MLFWVPFHSLYKWVFEWFCIVFTLSCVNTFTHISDSLHFILLLYSVSTTIILLFKDKCILE